MFRLLFKGNLDLYWNARGEKSVLNDRVWCMSNTFLFQDLGVSSNF